MNKIIAVDFDGTLCENKWPDIGEPNMPAIRALKRARVLHGAKVILWTCRTGKDLRAALDWCRAHGIEFDAVNENLPEMIAEFGENTRKIFANEYWDDRARRVEFGGGPK